MRNHEVELQLGPGQMPGMVWNFLFKTEPSTKILGFLTQSTLAIRDQTVLRQITCPIVEVEYIQMKKAIKAIEWLLGRGELRVEGYDMLGSLEESLNCSPDLMGEMAVTTHGISIQLLYDRKPFNEPFFWYPHSKTLITYRPVENISGYATIPCRK